MAGDFVFMAATLIHIKSKMLLPPPHEDGTEDDALEDPRAELVARLIEYQRYKDAAQMLYQQQTLRAAMWLRSDDAVASLLPGEGDAPDEIDVDGGRISVKATTTEGLGFTGRGEGIMALASVSDGTTRIRGAEELRVKESDRLAVMARGLESLGVRLKEYRDGIDIDGGVVKGGSVDGAGDHRCAMSFCILGQLADSELEVQGCRNIDTSYPGFALDLRAVGGQISQAYS